MKERLIQAGRLVIRLYATSLLIAVLISGANLGLMVYSAAATVRTELNQNWLADLPKTTTITDRHGEPLYYWYQDENRLVMPASAIPVVAKNAVIATEDERFYLHKGVDATAIVRAVRENLTNRTILSGGSTLTMQVVKNMTGDNRPNWQRKIKEAYLATILEERLSKEEILTLYLNMIPVGHNLSGVATASQFYFNKPAGDLTLVEAATIAALPTAPDFYASHPDALRRRRNYVLDRMALTGKISRAEAEAAQAVNTPIKDPIGPLKAPHFVMAVIAELKKEYGENWNSLGLTIRTSLDIPTQMLAEQTVKDRLDVLNQVRAGNVGLTVIEPKTGQVLAMVGSPDYFDKQREGEVNLTLAPLSYGSTLKPLIYALLLEHNHWSPGAIMWDVKTDFPIQGERKPYTPNNYDRRFFGPLTLRQALANSRNVTAVKALQIIGLPTALERLKQFGIESLGNDLSRYGPSLAVGGGGIPLVELLSGYTALANQGRANPAELIIDITDYQGNILKTIEPTNRPVLKPEVAYEIADILQDNAARSRVFGFNSLLVIPGHRVAAKTGTAEDYRSALTVGFTPKVVVGVIVANNDNSPLRPGGSGAMAAAPFFNTFMTRYLANKPDDWFIRPETIAPVEFATVIGKITDLAAPWQSPIDRFNRRIAEVDDPLWNRAVAIGAGKKEDPKEDDRAVVQTSGNRGLAGGRVQANIEAQNSEIKLD